MLGGATPGGQRAGALGPRVPRRPCRPAGLRGARRDGCRNLFELKNARRVLVEGNLFENNWVMDSPATPSCSRPRGEGGAAPWATIEDVTFRYNIIRNSSAVFNLLARDDGGASGTMRRVRIADNLIYAIDRAEWGGNGTFMQIGEGPSEITVEHNTIIHSGNVLTPTADRGRRRAWRSASSSATTSVRTTRTASSARASRSAPTRSTPSSRARCSSATPSPADRRLAIRRQPVPEMDRFSQQFVNYAGHDYRLKGDSEFRRAATDGADLGVNFVMLARRLARARANGSDSLRRRLVSSVCRRSRSGLHTCNGADRESYGPFPIQLSSRAATPRARSQLMRKSRVLTTEAGRGWSLAVHSASSHTRGCPLIKRVAQWRVCLFPVVLLWRAR